MDDELQETRDNFMVGNFHAAMNMCETFSASNDISASEKDAIFARCCLSMQQFDKLKSMQNSPCPGQRAAALTAILTMSKQEPQKAQARSKLMEIAKESQDLSTNVLAASALAVAGEHADALQITGQHPTLEMQALRVYILLKMNRTDLAERQLREMSGANDDSAAYRLAQAAVHLGTGNPEEAYLVYCDLATQFPGEPGGGDESQSTLLAVGKAVANMQRGMFSEAMEDLQRATGNTPNDPDVLVNLCCSTVRLAKREEFARYYASLEKAHPNHPYVQKTQGIRNAFARFAAKA
jgi:coatomer protein complex subunit epsilon